MEGVQILDTIYEKSPIIILWILLAMACAIVAVWYCVEQERYPMATYWAAVAVVFGVLAWWPVTCPTNVKYKVLIKDDMPYSEFIKKYDVLDTDGAILTITEKGTVVFREG